MKSYTITVNGNVYDVTVEEKSASQTAPAAAAPAAVPKMPAAQPPVQAPAQKAAAGKDSGKGGSGRESVPDSDDCRAECSARGCGCYY